MRRCPECGHAGDDFAELDPNSPDVLAAWFDAGPLPERLVECPSCALMLDERSTR